MNKQVPLKDLNPPKVGLNYNELFFSLGIVQFF